MAEGVKEADADGIVDAGATDIEPPPDPVNAPYGYTRDKKAPGGWRAKKRPGRGGNPNLRAAPDPGDEGQEGQEADGRDPQPSWRTGGRRSEPYEATPAQKNDVAAVLALLYSMPADFLLQVDPYCFGALNQQLGQIIDATVPIICRSETVVKYVTGSSGLILWVKLAAAFRPVLVAAWRHHVVHSIDIELDEETGLPVAVETDYSAYSAA